MQSQKYKSVTVHNGRYVWQLTVLGFPLRGREHFESAEDAALECDLVKYFFRTQFKLDLPSSLDGEQFSSLAYSRLHVALADSYSVEKSLPDFVLTFVSEHRAGLEAHRDSQPKETLASKLRRSWNFNNQPEVREWVEKVERAELEAEAFSALNQTYFFSLLDASSARLTDVLKPLRLALKMHGSADHPRLVARRVYIAALIVHLEQNLEYVKDLTADLLAEEANVRSAVATLEAARPQLN